MKYILVILILSEILLPQTKYFIYFKDKKSLFDNSKNIQFDEKALRTEFSESAILRRQNLYGSNIFNYDDIPIAYEYIYTLINLGIKPINKLNWFNCISAYLDSEQIKKLNELPFIEKIEPVKILRYRKNEISYKRHLPDYLLLDSISYGNSFFQNFFHSINVVHSSSITGEDVIIGLIDSGFRWKKHSSLKYSNVIAEYDFVKKDSITENQPNDYPTQDDHGTYVMSIIGGNSPGNMIGTSFNSKFILAKTEDIASESKIEEDNYVAALEWMDKLGVHIISSSVGYNTFDDPSTNYSYKDMDGNTTITAKAVDKAFQKGIVIVQSAGNEGNNNWRYIVTPADAKYVIAVGAVNPDKSIAGYSSRGPTYDGRIKPDVCALGTSVYGASVISPDSYSFSSGTSVSTPIVAGIAALLKSCYPEINHFQIRDHIRLTSSQWSKPDTVYGWGIVDAVKILSFPLIVNRKILNDSNYFMLKSFFSENIDSSSLKLFLLQDNILKDYNMSLVKNNKYQIKIPDDISKYDKIRFYFTYKDKSGKIFRIPEDNNSTFSFILIDKKVYNESVPINNIKDWQLFQNYPNPFKDITRFKFSLVSEQTVTIKIFDILGRLVKNLINEVNFSKGEHYSVIWDGTDNYGKELASGIYFYRIQTQEFTNTKKLILLK